MGRDEGKGVKEREKGKGNHSKENRKRERERGGELQIHNNLHVERGGGGGREWETGLKVRHSSVTINVC